MGKDPPPQHAHSGAPQSELPSLPPPAHAWGRTKSFQQQDSGSGGSLGSGGGFRSWYNTKGGLPLQVGSHDDDADKTASGREKKGELKQQGQQSGAAQAAAGGESRMKGVASVFKKGMWKFGGLRKEKESSASSAAPSATSNSSSKGGAEAQAASPRHFYSGPFPFPADRRKTTEARRSQLRQGLTPLQGVGSPPSSSLAVSVTSDTHSTDSDGVTSGFNSHAASHEVLSPLPPHVKSPLVGDKPKKKGLLDWDLLSPNAGGLLGSKRGAKSSQQQQEAAATAAAALLSSSRSGRHADSLAAQGRGVSSGAISGPILPGMMPGRLGSKGAGNPPADDKSLDISFLRLRQVESRLSAHFPTTPPSAAAAEKHPLPSPTPPHAGRGDTPQRPQTPEDPGGPDSARNRIRVKGSSMKAEDESPSLQSRGAGAAPVGFLDAPGGSMRGGGSGGAGDSAGKSGRGGAGASAGGAGDTMIEVEVEEIGEGGEIKTKTIPARLLEATVVHQGASGRTVSGRIMLETGEVMVVQIEEDDGPLSLALQAALPHAAKGERERARDRDRDREKERDRDRDRERREKGSFRGGDGADRPRSKSGRGGETGAEGELRSRSRSSRGESAHEHHKRAHGLRGEDDSRPRSRSGRGKGAEGEAGEVRPRERREKGSFRGGDGADRPRSKSGRGRETGAEGELRSRSRSSRGESAHEHHKRAHGLRGEDDSRPRSRSGRGKGAEGEAGEVRPRSRHSRGSEGRRSRSIRVDSAEDWENGRPRSRSGRGDDWGGEGEGKARSKSKGVAEGGEGALEGIGEGSGGGEGAAAGLATPRQRRLGRTRSRALEEAVKAAMGGDGEAESTTPGALASADPPLSPLDAVQPRADDAALTPGSRGGASANVTPRSRARGARAGGMGEGGAGALESPVGAAASPAGGERPRRPRERRRTQSRSGMEEIMRGVEGAAEGAGGAGGARTPVSPYRGKSFGRGEDAERRERLRERGKEGASPREMGGAGAAGGDGAAAQIRHATPPPTRPPGERGYSRSRSRRVAEEGGGRGAGEEGGGAGRGKPARSPIGGRGSRRRRSVSRVGEEFGAITPPVGTPTALTPTGVSPMAVSPGFVPPTLSNGEGGGAGSKGGDGAEGAVSDMFEGFQVGAVVERVAERLQEHGEKRRERAGGRGGKEEGRGTVRKVRKDEWERIKERERGAGKSGRAVENGERAERGKKREEDVRAKGGEAGGEKEGEKESEREREEGREKGDDKQEAEGVESVGAIGGCTEVGMEGVESVEAHSEVQEKQGDGKAGSAVVRAGAGGEEGMGAAATAAESREEMEAGEKAVQQQDVAVAAAPATVLPAGPLPTVPVVGVGGAGMDEEERKVLQLKGLARPSALAVAVFSPTSARLISPSATTSHPLRWCRGGGSRGAEGGTGIMGMMRTSGEEEEEERPPELMYVRSLSTLRRPEIAQMQGGGVTPAARQVYYEFGPIGAARVRAQQCRDHWSWLFMQYLETMLPRLAVQDDDDIMSLTSTGDHLDDDDNLAFPSAASSTAFGSSRGATTAVAGGAGGGAWPEGGPGVRVLRPVGRTNRNWSVAGALREFEWVRRKFRGVAESSERLNEGEEEDDNEDDPAAPGGGSGGGGGGAGGGAGGGSLGGTSPVRFNDSATSSTWRDLPNSSNSSPWHGDRDEGGDGRGRYAHSDLGGGGGGYAGSTGGGAYGSGRRPSSVAAGLSGAGGDVHTYGPKRWGPEGSLQSRLVAEALGTGQALPTTCQHDDILRVAGLVAAISSWQPSTACMCLLRLLDRMAQFELLSLGITISPHHDAAAVAAATAAASGAHGSVRGGGALGPSARHHLAGIGNEGSMPSSPAGSRRRSESFTMGGGGLAEQTGPIPTSFSGLGSAFGAAPASAAPAQQQAAAAAQEASAAAAGGRGGAAAAAAPPPPQKKSGGGLLAFTANITRPTTPFFGIGSSSAASHPAPPPPEPTPPPAPPSNVSSPPVSDLSGGPPIAVGPMGMAGMGGMGALPGAS
ncbi:unnamed protein product [Closterium sp. Naga37s-1]|nr:unnamed protein product [Closterium sp. Naga37s-1]